MGLRVPLHPVDQVVAVVLAHARADFRPVPEEVERSRCAELHQITEVTIRDERLREDFESERRRERDVQACLHGDRRLVDCAKT